MAAGRGSVLMKWYLVFILLQLWICEICNGNETTINSAFISHRSLLDENNEIVYKLKLQVSGVNICNIMVKPTSYTGIKGSECFSDFTVMSVIYCEPSRMDLGYVIFSIPANSSVLQPEDIYLCVESTDTKSKFVYKMNSTFGDNVIKWIHQGENIKLRTADDVKGGSVATTDDLKRNFNWKRGLQHKLHRARRDDSLVSTDRNVPNSDGVFGGTSLPIVVTGMRVESADRDPVLGDDGIISLLEGSNVVLRLFGSGFTNSTKLTATRSKSTNGKCDFPDMHIYNVHSLRESSVLVNFVVPTGSPNSVYYFCVKDDSQDHWSHQGIENWLSFRTFTKLLPIWVSIAIIMMCLCFSALFSGLNLGLMSMDQTDLQIVANTGSETEKRHARAIIPVRKRGNFLLCSILLGNVLVNSSLTILMDDLTSGLVAVIGSTLAIVVFGEITPQAICSRHGLAVGAYTIYVTKLVMIITFPLAFPISLLLDYLLGAELGNVYTRERLKELIKLMPENLEKDEVNIISGALELRRKVVAEIMTKLEDVYMLDIDNTILDFETISEIMKQGYSRIPVFEERRSNIVTVLYIKDLAFVDPDDNTPLKTLCKFYRNPCNFVFEDTTLDVMFRQFKEGIKGHMAFVHRVNSEGEGDPFYETIGLVTLEDVIEELIQEEIVDETDVWIDNRSKRRRTEKTMKQDFTVFAERQENQRIHISPQLTLATFQYLSTAVDAFRPEIISETILRRLLKQDIIHHIKMKNREKSKNDPNTIIFSQGKAVDYFVLILEGRVEVIVGKENMMFESGPFTYFGTQALTQNVGIAESPTSQTSQALGSLHSVDLDSMLHYTFIPDYTVRAITEVFYIRIKRSVYLTAKRATLMERAKENSQTAEQFDDEVEKLLHSYNEDERSQDYAGTPTLASTGQDSVNNLLELEKDKVQECIAAAEHGAVVISNNMPSLNSLSVSGMLSPLSPGSPVNTSSTPINIPAPKTEPNGRVRLSPTKVVITDRTKSPGSTEEHTALLSQSPNKI